MAEYKIRDVLDPSPITGKTAIKNFINACREKQTANTKSKLYKTLEQKSDEPLCYEITYKGKNYITFYRKALEIILNQKIKSVFTAKSINTALTRLAGEYTSGDFFELINQNDSKTTSEKQDFTCYAVWYFFNNRTASIYDFYEHIKITNDLLSSNKSKLSVSSTSETLKEFSLLHNYPYVLDSVAVAKSLIRHRGKLNIRGSLASYSIAEEDSAEGIRYKSVPLKR